MTTVREVIIQIYCDWCKEDVPESVVAEIKITVGSKEYEGDACPKCATELTEEMRPVKKTRARRKRATGDTDT